MDIDSRRGRLKNVYWIGGGSGAGKSTISRRLATRYGLKLYPTDDAMRDHARRCPTAECPFLAEFLDMSQDERWLDRSPQTMLATFHWFRGEGFRLIIEDLLALSSDEGVIVEGFRLLPQLVKPLLARSNKSIWLIPTPEFRLAAFESRGTLWSIAGTTSNPERALDNLLERDRLFTAQLMEMCQTAEVPVIEVGSALSEDALENLVASQFGLDEARR